MPGEQSKNLLIPHWELYELGQDPHEMNNVYNHPAYSKVREELKAELLKVKKELGDTDEKYPELMEVRWSKFFSSSDGSLFINCAEWIIYKYQLNLQLMLVPPEKIPLLVPSIILKIWNIYLTKMNQFYIIFVVALVCTNNLNFNCYYLFQFRFNQFNKLAKVIYFNIYTVVHHHLMTICPGDYHLDFYP